jgi:hypothetical protein
LEPIAVLGVDPVAGIMRDRLAERSFVSCRLTGGGASYACRMAKTHCALDMRRSCRVLALIRCQDKFFEIPLDRLGPPLYMSSRRSCADRSTCSNPDYLRYGGFTRGVVAGRHQAGVAGFSGTPQ